MSSFPGSPRPLKGALVSVDPMNPLASIVIFQYNPSELTRSLEPQFAKSGHTPAGTQFLSGPPTETISLSIEINATDQLDRGELIATEFGIYPQLACIETAMSPKVLQVAKALLAAAAGTIEVVPPTGPLTLFVWGIKRVQPVQITSYSVNETYHDPSLNPIAAKVDLRLRALTFQDFASSDMGLKLALAQMAVKEAMAVVGSLSNVAGAVASLVGT